MQNWLERAELLIKKEGIEKLNQSHILVVGLGGVGSFAVEFLTRSGIGKMTIADGDVIDRTNINRQLPALHSTIGLYKTDILEKRIKDINPNIQLEKITEFLTPEKMEQLINNQKFDYIVDCIDSVTPKISLIIKAKRKKVKIISVMGAGGKTDPSKVSIKDISKTNNCFLAKQIRKRIKKEGINKGIKCVFSSEIQKECSLKMTDGQNYKRSFYGTISFMPALFGLYAAAEVINYLTQKTN